MLKRTLSLLTLIMLIVPLLTACGGENPTATSVPAPATATTAAPAATATTAAPAAATDTTAAGNSGAAATTAAGNSGAAATTGVMRIYANGNAATTWVRNFNPFAGKPLYPTTYGIYEPLMIYSVPKAAIVPWLADKYEWSADNKTLTFTLHDGVKWSDGQTFTASDVVYTFNLLKTVPGLQGTGLQAVGSTGYVESVAAPDAKTVVFTFKRVFTPGVYDIISQNIVPEHIWKDITDPVKSTNDNPVGTGPFTEVKNFGAQVYQVDKNPYYWQPGKPYINGIRVPTLGGNDQATVAFAKGDIDWGGWFVINPEKAVISKNPTDLHTGSSINPGTGALFIVNTTIKPLDDPVVRKAMSMSFDRAQMMAIILGGQGTPGDVTGLNSAAADWKPKDPSALGDWTTFNPDKANQLLEAAGYKKGGDGFRTAPDGKKMSFEFTMINGFSDFIAVAPTIIDNLKAIGIEARQKNDDFPVAFGNWQQGKFEMSLFFGVSAPTPFTVYTNLMSTRTVAPVGQSTSVNFHRYGSAAADALLDQWAATSDVAKQHAIALQLVKIFADEAPVIPMWQNLASYFYNTKSFAGFPTKDNNYTLGGPSLQSPEQLIVMTTVKPK